MDLCTAENSAICSIFSKVLFSNSMFATKLENSVNFAIFSIDSSESGDRGATIFSEKFQCFKTSKRHL